MLHPLARPAAVGSEELREALLAVERFRQEEQRARKEAEALLDGLRVLTNAHSVQELFVGILQVVRGVVPFSDAAVLVSDGSRLSIAAATSPALECGLSQLPVDGVVKRALDGRAAVVSDLMRVPEWAGLPPELRDRFASAMALPVRTRDHSAMFLCLHAERAAFGRHQLGLLEYFMPLAAQALQRSYEIAELDRMMRRFEHLAHHDVLTGLGNRALFSKRLESAIAQATADGLSVGILHLDLDDFKVINDTMGHAAGDQFLAAIGSRLRDELRGIDGVARIGGDEFAVVLAGLQAPADALAVAERLLPAVTVPIWVQGRHLHPRISIGVATYPADGRTAERVLACADVALYSAKAAGRNRVSSFDARMRAELAEQDAVETDLRRGIEAGELRVLYQPILRASDLGLTAVEALVRWQHPDRGLLSPAQFLGTADRSDLINLLGQVVLDQSLGEAADWLRAGPDRRLAVNVAARQLLAPSFSRELKATLQRHGLPPSALELELSEEIVARRTARSAIDMLHQLDAMGVELAFDDFGTGYSSIFQLRSFPGHRLKIDRSFVERMLVDETDAAVVRGMIDLAHGLSLRVVAEGVETAQQARALIAYGCDELQGYHFGRPASLAATLAAAATIRP